MQVESLLFFILSVVVGSIAAILIYVKSPSKYFLTREGKGVLRGILLVVSIVLLIAVGSALLGQRAEASDEGLNLKYLNAGEVYLGLEDTFGKVSPMCVENSLVQTEANSDRLTSNLGVIVDLVSTGDDMASVSFKYTHHSCAFNPDNRGYDAAGIVFRYKLW